ncbi:MAG: hypothetical protein K0Q76_1723 [Panacagrimonas sp.]|nr:hypothetical protein [Panacagrimonas sp.]
MVIEWINVAAGFGVGVLVGLTGVGGGSLMAPLLLLVFGVAPAAVVGTDLWFAAITKVFGAWIHGKKGSIDWEVLRRLFMGSIPAVLLTMAWLHLGGGHTFMALWTKKAIGIVLVVTAVAALFRAQILDFGRRRRLGSPETFKRIQPGLTVAGGAVIGCLVTLTSIGAGALGAVILLYLYPLRMKPQTLVGTDIVHAIPLTVLAGSGHLWMGNVDVRLLGWLLIGSIPGIILGSLGASRAPQKVLRLLITGVLTLVGVKMIVS